MPYRTAAALLLSVVLPALLVPAAARADAGSLWAAAPAAGDRPAAAQGRGAFYLEGAAGAVLADRLSVVNPGDRPRTIELHATGGWIALATARVGVPPRTRAEVPLTVTVPAGTPPGDHAATVVAGGEGRVVRVPVTVRVRGPALSALSVEHVRVGGTGRGAVIAYEVVNRGSTVLAPTVTLRAEGLFGEVLRQPAARVPASLAPGARARLSQEWPGAPRLDRLRVSVTATAADGAYAAASAAYVPLPWLWPSLAAAGAVAVAAAVLGAVRRAGRRRARP
ncbi:hypothetical protein [Streptomyces sp. NPDC049555]|uniref:COG1470 family protein n=1 Tax=Streptomyces sp. NPDC049555 TaxID=3154930 RepID=UPI003419A777